MKFKFITATIKRTKYGDVMSLDDKLFNIIYEAYDKKKLHVEGQDAKTALDDKSMKGKVLPLHFASSTGSTSVVGAMIEAGADVNKQDEKGYTPLDIALRKNDHGMVLHLLQNEASIDKAKIPNKDFEAFFNKTSEEKFTNTVNLSNKKSRTPIDKIFDKAKKIGEAIKSLGKRDKPKISGAGRAKDTQSRSK